MNGPVANNDSLDGGKKEWTGLIPKREAALRKGLLDQGKKSFGGKTPTNLIKV